MPAEQGGREGSAGREAVPVPGGETGRGAGWQNEPEVSCCVPPGSPPTKGYVDRRALFRFRS